MKALEYALGFLFHPIEESTKLLWDEDFEKTGFVLFALAALITGTTMTLSNELGLRNIVFFAQNTLGSLAVLFIASFLGSAVTFLVLKPFGADTKPEDIQDGLWANGLTSVVHALAGSLATALSVIFPTMVVAWHGAALMATVIYHSCVQSVVFRTSYARAFAVTAMLIVVAGVMVSSL